jgi:glutathione synthase/RimK-type ligase-like ATP-grasp enzyme
VDPVALVTDAAHGGGSETDAALVGALAGVGFDACWVCWDDDAVDWSAFRLAVVRSPWDYTQRYEAFLAWIDTAGRATELWNPPSLLRWSSHKGYLLELAQQGVPIVPTVLVRGWEACPDLDRLVEVNGWDGLVLKPAVSAGASRTSRWSAAEAAGPAAAELAGLHAAGDVLVQPFVPEVASAGETSVVFLGGRYSHALRKVPASGDFRVQEHHGGSTTPTQALPDEIRLARHTLAALEVPTLYARVDCVAVAGSPVLMELEVLEPDLYLSLDEQAPARFAAAVAAMVQAGPGAPCR